MYRYGERMHEQAGGRHICSRKGKHIHHNLFRRLGSSKVHTVCSSECVEKSLPASLLTSVKPHFFLRPLQLPLLDGSLLQHLV